MTAHPEHVAPRGVAGRLLAAESAREGLPRMTESELIASLGGIPMDRNGAMSVREMHQRAVAAAIEEAEARLIARGIAPIHRGFDEEMAS